MPAKPRLSTRPSPPASSTSHPKTTAPPFLAVWDCDDDDDFQSPPHASRARPLKLCNAAASSRHRKKLKPSPAFSGKDNRPVAGGTAPAERVAAMAAEADETLAVGSWASAGVPEDKEATGGGICGLFRSGPDGSKLGANGKKGLGGYGNCMGSSSCRPNSTESRVLEPGAACDLGGGHCEGSEEVGSRACTSVPEGAELGRAESDPSSMQKEWNGSGPREGHYYSRPIEPRLPEFNAKCKFGGVGFKEAEELGSGVHGSASGEGNVDTESGVASRSEIKKNEGSGFGVHNGNYRLNSIESKRLVSNAKYDFEGGDFKESQEPGLGICSLVSEGREVVAEDVATLNFETREKKSSGTEDCKGSCCSNFVESTLLGSRTIHYFEADDCGNFEIGTQLNELINLCMEDYVEGHPNSRASPLEESIIDSGRFESVYKVQCPLCGSDISDLSEELQLVHTNNCLDEGGPAKESNSNHEREPCARENVENMCVVEWLRNLGLSRYEDIFIREEVDWETLQWLTEEDLLGMGITSLGPRKKIIHALGELRKKNDHANDAEADVLISENTKKTRLPMNGNKLITEYFPCSSFDKKQTKACKVNKPSNLNSQKNSSAKHAPSRSRTGKAKVKETPLWCCIPAEGAVYLWTLPMFHCNGWCYTWTLAALCATSICLRQVTAKAIFSAIANQGVTHFCGAPVVLNTIINAPPADTILPLPRVVNVMTAGAAPPPSVLASMSKLGFRITHTYGLSETYGPSTVCAWKPEWDSLPADERARLHARQGIRYVGLEGLDVVEPKTMAPVPADGSTLGEIVMRGNGVMKGYLKNPKANTEAFENGWFHSGDLGVKHPDGYIEVKDRAKDIIISGGENISSLEVEKAVYLHPVVLEASVVARADEQWGESPCAFVTLKDGVDRSNEAELAGNIVRFCRERLPGYWVPKSVVFGPLPKTATGKIKKHELRAKAKELGPVRKSRM